MYAEFPIFTAPLADSLPGWLHRQSFSSVFVLTDNNTRTHCLPHLLKIPDFNDTLHILTIKPGEQEKNLDSCALIWAEMKNAGLDRKALFISLGGGVVGDMGGFCAATWKRGIEFVQIPTTLLAMTDAAIGGKTGVDFMGVKNIIGVIRQPAAVFTDPVFLKTLPDRELRSGMAEVFKHAAISGELSSGWISAMAQLDSTEPDWMEILTKSVSVKIDIVRQDPEENGLRMLLNMGHTIGHAVESCLLDTGEALTHGEAVAVGMICELYIAESRGVVVPDADLLIKYLPAIFRLPRIDPGLGDSLWTLMCQDKKNASGNVRITLPDAPHSMQILNISRSDLDSSIKYYNNLI